MNYGRKNFMNKYKEHILLAVFGLLILANAVSVYIALKNTSAEIPMRANKLDLDGCETNSQTLSLFVGENLTLTNTSSSSHKYRLFNEEFSLEPNEQKSFALDYSNSMFGRILCDDNFETTYVKLSIPEFERNQ